MDTPNLFSLTDDELYEYMKQDDTTRVVDFREDLPISMIPPDTGYKFDVEQSLINFDTPNLFELEMKTPGFSDFNPPVDEVLRQRLITREKEADLNTRITSNIANLRIFGEDPVTNKTNQKIEIIKEFSRKYGLSKEEEKRLIQKALEKHLLDDVLQRAQGVAPQAGQGNPAPGAPPAVPDAPRPRRPEPANAGAGLPEPDEAGAAVEPLSKEARTDRALRNATVVLDNELSKKSADAIAILGMILDEKETEDKIKKQYKRRTLAKTRQKLVDFLKRQGFQFGAALSDEEIDIIYQFYLIVREELGVRKDE